MNSRNLTPEEQVAFDLPKRWVSGRINRNGTGEKMNAKCEHRSSQDPISSQQVEDWHRMDGPITAYDGNVLNQPVCRADFSKFKCDLCGAIFHRYCYMVREWHPDDAWRLGLEAK